MLTTAGKSTVQKPPGASSQYEVRSEAAALTDNRASSAEMKELLPLIGHSPPVVAHRQPSIQRQPIIQRVTIGNMYTINPVPALAPTLLQTGVGYAKQGRYVTRLLQAGEYIMTLGFTACTAFAIWDPVASVASLAHFDGDVKAADITGMVDEMIQLGANAANMQFAAVGNDYNQTIKAVWNSIDPRLNPAPLPLLSYPPPNPPIQGPANLFHGSIAMVAANGWLGGE